MLYFLMILNLSDCLKFIFPAPFLLEKLKAKNQVYLVKHLINESRKCFSLDAESTYSNILKDLFDLLEELEHGVYFAPCCCSVRVTYLLCLAYSTNH